MKNLTLPAVVFVSLICATTSGCAKSDAAPEAGNARPADAAHDGHAGHAHGDHEHGDHDHADHAHEQATDGHDHSGWWCAEHGVPEEVCGQCNAKLAAKFQQDGDWCQKHDRPDSQCFACHPELEAVFAAKYEAKYGKQPPKPEG
ncbi:MAG: RND transporter [Pirellulales bacterium]